MILFYVPHATVRLDGHRYVVRHKYLHLGNQSFIGDHHCFVYTVASRYYFYSF